MFVAEIPRCQGGCTLSASFRKMLAPLLSIRLYTCKYFSCRWPCRLAHRKLRSPNLALKAGAAPLLSHCLSTWPISSNFAPISSTRDWCEFICNSTQIHKSYILLYHFVFLLSVTAFLFSLSLFVFLKSFYFEINSINE